MSKIKVFGKKAMVTTLCAATLFSSALIIPAVSNYSSETPFSITANAANGVVTGCFNGFNWTGTTTVHSKNTRKSCSIKICTFDKLGWWNYGKFDYVVYGDGKYIGTYDNKCRGWFTLPKGYSTYEVRLRVHTFSKKGDNFINVGKCVYWSIDGGSNCWV